MTLSALKKNRFIHDFNSINHTNIKFQGALILKMYGALNKINLYNENRYILCNFIDQYGDLLNIQEDIYMTNREKNLSQLFLLAFNNAKKHDLLTALYEEYSSCLHAITSKKEFQS